MPIDAEISIIIRPGLINRHSMFTGDTQQTKSLRFLIKNHYSFPRLFELIPNLKIFDEPWEKGGSQVLVTK